MTELSTSAIEFLMFIHDSPNGVATVASMQSKFGDVAHDRINMLCREKLISSHDYAKPDSSGFLVRVNHPISYQLTVYGQDTLEVCLNQLKKEHEREASAKAYQALDHQLWKKDARRSWIQWAVTFSFSVVSFIAGIVVEHHSGVVDFIRSLFH